MSLGLMSVLFSFHLLFVCMIIVRFNIDNPFFEGMVNQIYPPELQLNKAHTSGPRPPFWICIYLLLTVLFPPKFMLNVMTSS